MARNARSQQLASQRSRYSGLRLFSERRRVPGSLSSAISSIAKTAVQTQLQSKIAAYNSGELSNDDMLTFLKSINGSAALSPSEKASVSSQISEFTDRIRSESLMATYNNTQKGTVDRASAAQALADFYTQKAANASPDSPAASTALQNAGQWKQTAAAEVDSVNKAARSLKRAQLMNQVAQAQPGTQEEAMQKAQAFQELASQARADGAETEAVQMETNAQNAVNEIPAIQERAAKTATAAERADIVNTINTIANAYHDGTITPQEFAAAIDPLDKRAMAIGDTSIQLSLNKWSDTLAKDIEKGVRHGTLDGGDGTSLPVVLGKGGGGSGTQTDWDQQDGNYQKAMDTMQKWVTKGKDDSGKAYTYQDYVNDMALQLQNREQTLSDRMDVLTNENPNMRIYVNGKKVRVADVIDGVNKEMDTASGAATGDNTQDGGIQERLNSLVNGNVVMIMETPNEVSKSGNVSKGGRAVAKIDLVDANSFDPSNYIQDERGVYHQLQKEYRPLTDAEKKQVISGYLYDKKGNAYKVNGNQVETGKQYADVYDANTSFSKRRFINAGDKSIQGITDAERQAYQLQTDANLRKATGAAELTPSTTPNPNASDTAKIVQKGQAGEVLQQKQPGNGVLDTAKNLFTQPQINPMDVVKTVAPVVKSAADTIGNVIAPKSQFKTPEELNLPANQPLVPPQTSPAMPAPAIIQPPKENPASPSAPLSIVGQVPQNNIQKTFAGQPQIKIQGPSIPAKPTGPANLGDILKGIGGLATKLWPFK